MIMILMKLTAGEGFGSKSMKLRKKKQGFLEVETAMGGLMNGMICPMCQAAMHAKTKGRP